MTAENKEVETNSTELPPIKIEEVGSDKVPQDINKFGAKIIICEMINDLPHEIATAHLKANKPFTKELLDEFISKQTTIDNIRKVAEAENTEIKIFTIIANN